MSLLYKTSIPVNGEKLQENVSGKFQYPRHYSFQNKHLFQCFWNETFTSFSASLICSVFVCFLQFNLEWKQTFKEKKILLAWRESPFNFWPALFWIPFLPIVFTSELSSPRDITSITKALKSNACYLQLNEHVGLLLTFSKHWCKKDMIV